MTKLQLGETLSATDIYDLPSGATFVSPEDQVLVSCSRPAVDEEEDLSPGATGAEPEIIKKGKEDGEEGEE
jgi:large subunit ribosomal protein L25